MSRWLVILLLFCCSQPAAFSAPKPNVILILTDDQGYGDISAHGNPILKTPHLDQLHAESARLTDFHVDPTCAPTRAALLTGKYSHRVRVWTTIAGGNHLRESETTMADVFRDLIYGDAKTRFKKLPVAAVRLTVGDKTQTLAATTGAKEGLFDFMLEKNQTVPVKAELLDSSGKTLAGGYYVYCRLTNP